MAPHSKNEFSRTDLSTLSNYAAAKSTKIDLQWHIDFDKRVIIGSVTHSVEVIIANTTKVKFDSSKLHVSGVSINDAPTTYERAESSPSLGTCLAVEIPANLRQSGSQFDVTFHYSTDQDASAVQWLDSKATSSGNYPFVFTQVCLYCDLNNVTHIIYLSYTCAHVEPDMQCKFSAKLFMRVLCFLVKTLQQSRPRTRPPSVPPLGE